MSNILIIILKRWLYFLIWSSFNHYNISRCPIPNWNGISSQRRAHLAGQQNPVLLTWLVLPHKALRLYYIGPFIRSRWHLFPSSHICSFILTTKALLSLSLTDFLTKTCWLSRCFLLVHTLALYQFSKLFPLSMKPRAVLYDSNFVFWKHWPSTCIINKNTIMDIAWHYHI